jgi:hypothetical protein
MIMPGARFGGGVLLLAATLVGAPASAAVPPGEFFRGPSGRSNESETESESESEPELQVVSGAALKKEIPDLVVSSWPPRWDVTLALAQHYPLQVFGLSVGIAGFPLPWLRVSADYSVGMQLGRRGDVHLSNYVDGIVSFKLLGGDSSMIKDVYRPKRIPLTPLQRARRENALVLRAALPSHHALLVEGGLLTGSLALFRCTDRCELPKEDRVTSQRIRQVVYPVGGLRYVYSVNARSMKRPEVDHVRVRQLFAHAIVRPLNDWADAHYYGSGLHRVKRTSVGFRGGISVPVCWAVCAVVGFTGGWLPSPGAPLVELSVGL